MPKMFANLVCCKVDWLTDTHPAASAMGEFLIKSKGPIGGVT